MKSYSALLFYLALVNTGEIVRAKLSNKDKKDGANNSLNEQRATSEWLTGKTSFVSTNNAMVQEKLSEFHKYVREVDELRNFLNNIQNTRSNDTYEEMLRKTEIYSRITFPGTNWCGAGNSASNYEDLGYFKEADKCCRAHDYCPLTINGGKTKFGLTNNYSYTLSHCNCDDKFMKCLKSADDYVSSLVGNSFFDIVAIKCFKKDYPIVKCLKYRGWFIHECSKYQLDETKPKIWQFFDPKEY